MKVKLLDVHKEEVINKLYVAARTCYSKGSPIDMFNTITDNSEAALEKRVKLIKQVFNSGHLSIAEHASVTFLISGVDRALTHQLVRHRAGVVFSQQSQRYCNLEDTFDYVIPKEIEKNQEALDMFKQTMETIHTVYNTLINIGIKAEDARAVLPNACCTNLTMTVNLRELTQICELRLCSCAQYEIRTLVNMMAFAVKSALPFMAEYLVPKCERLGYCNEPKKRSCGRKKTREDVFSM